MTVTTPNVAPFESCVRCLKGDTDTGFALNGEAEWMVAGMHKLADIPLDQATNTFMVYADAELGCDPGKVPGGETTMIVRLCRDCADSIGTKVGDLSATEAPGYRQPDELK